MTEHTVIYHDSPHWKGNPRWIVRDGPAPLHDPPGGCCELCGDDKGTLTWMPAEALPPRFVSSPGEWLCRRCDPTSSPPERAAGDEGTGKSLIVERTFTISVKGRDSQTLLYGIQEYLVFIEQRAWTEDSHRKHCLFSSLEEALRQQDAG